MLSNYLKISLRSLFRNKLYSSINILGLTVGLSCVILIALYVLDELTFDRFHQKSDQIFRVVETKSTATKGDETTATVPYSIAKEAVKNFPEVENSLTFGHMGRTAISDETGQKSFYEQFFIAEQSFLELFDFQLLKGDPVTCLKEPNTVVLEQELAEKLFGEADPIGKIIETDRDLNFTVTGVLATIPGNSHLQFNALFSFATVEKFDWFKPYQEGDWTSNDWLHYLQLKEGVNADAISQKVTAMVASHQEEETTFNSAFYLQPLKDIHFHSEGFEGDLNENKSSLSYVYIFVIVGFFVLLIACINYMNLATARSSTYGKEVGIRKVVGADRSSLVSRFFSETFIISLIAFSIAINVVHLALPTFNTFTGKELSLGLGSSSYLLPLLLGLMLVVGMLAGIYPSFYLAKFNPAIVLKGIVNKERREFNLRKSLVVFQFVLSIILIIATGIAFSQLQYIQNKNLGFNEGQLVVVDINSGAVRNGYKTIQDNYAGLAAVKTVAVSSRVPGEWKVLPRLELNLPEGPSEEAIEPYFIGADEYFLQTFEIDLIEGRNFEQGRMSDSTAVIINETAAKQLGIETIGEEEYEITSVNFDGNERGLNTSFNVRVIGIAKDFHFQSLHEEIKPIFMGYRNNPIHRIDYFTARVTPENMDHTLAEMERILHSVDPGHLFEYHFLDDQLAQFYENDQRRSSIFSMAALLAIFIACLGLFGLSAFAAERRTKEIGIRKVLGASIFNLISLLSKDFLSLVGIALIIAIPVAWFVSQKWLQNFAYSVDMNWWMFIGPGFIAILIALLTVSFQAIKTAMNNPVESLRYE